jgi:hypothetical protein
MNIAIPLRIKGRGHNVHEARRFNALAKEGN